MKLLRKSKSIIHIWIITYICILFIPVIANVIICISFANGMNKETENYNETYLNKIAAEVDSTLLDNIMFTEQLSNDRLLMEIASYEGKPDLYGYRRISEFVNNKLVNYRDKVTEDTMLYLKNSGCMLAKQSMAEGIVAYETFPLDINMGLEEWQRIVSNSYNHSYMQLGDDLYEIHTLFGGSGSEVNVFIPFKKAVFSWKESNKLFPDGVNIAIYNIDGSVVYSPDDLFKIEGMEFGEKQGTFSAKIGRTANTVCYCKSNVGSWVYLMAAPVDEFYKNTRNIIMLEIIVLIFGIVIGIVGVIVFSIYNFRPIKEIISGLGGTPDNSGYEFIEHSINRIKYRYNDMSRRTLLARVLMDSVSTGEKLLHDYDISVPAEAAAVVMSVEDTGDMLTTEKHEDIEVFFGALENVFCEVAEKYGFKAYFTNCDGVISILLDASGEISVVDLLIKIEDIYESVLGIKCTICCGGIESSIASIEKSYTRAKQVLAWMRFMQESGVGTYNPQTAYTGNFGEKLLNKLRVAVTSGGEWQSVTDELFRFGIEKPALQDMRLVMYDISKIIMQISKEKNISSVAEELKIKSIADAESFSMFREKMQEIVNEINSYTESEEEQVDNIAKIKAFISQNYKDSNLNNHIIAEHVGVSVNYISKYFKEQTGEGLLNYITRIRVQYAKELLATTDMVIKDIAVEVGFYNALALMRAYKKVEGITPTQYRRINDDKE